jgi:hypothetical protein
MHITTIKINQPFAQILDNLTESSRLATTTPNKGELYLHDLANSQTFAFHTIRRKSKLKATKNNKQSTHHESPMFECVKNDQVERHNCCHINHHKTACQQFVIVL